MKLKGKLLLEIIVYFPSARHERHLKRSHFPDIPAIATETLVTLFQSIHGMFRPLQYNTIALTLFEVLLILQRIRCSLIVTYWCESSNIYLQSEF
jgi:hypothetical protein